MRTNNVNFCVDQNIIYCKFNGGFNKKYKKNETEELLYDTVYKLSNGTYMPILINLEEVGFLNSIRIFNFLAHNRHKKSLILTQVFLVRSTFLKIILSIYNFNNNPISQNIFSNDFDKAKDYCHKENNVFNTLNKQ